MTRQQVFVVLRVNPGILDTRSVQTLVQHALRSSYGDSSAMYNVDVLDSRPIVSQCQIKNDYGKKSKERVTQKANERRSPPACRVILRMEPKMMEPILAALTVTVFPPTVVANYPISIDVLQTANHLVGLEMNTTVSK
jgi:hypothetical protein